MALGQSSHRIAGSGAAAWAAPHTKSRQFSSSVCASLSTLCWAPRSPELQELPGLGCTCTPSGQVNGTSGFSVTFRRAGRTFESPSKAQQPRPFQARGSRHLGTGVTAWSVIQPLYGHEKCMGEGGSVPGAGLEAREGHGLSLAFKAWLLPCPIWDLTCHSCSGDHHCGIS